jgi:membrane associated rhomboid family serine protease
MASPRSTRRFSFGGRVVPSIGGMIVLVVVASLISAFVSRHGAPLMELAALEPARVWRGEVWRLVTWPLVESSPLWLIVDVFILYWVGNQLGEVWSNKRIAVVAAALVALGSTATCLVALADSAVLGSSHLGPLAVISGLIVAWGLFFPEREILFFFLIRLPGLVIAWLTVAIVVVLSVYQGWEGHLPELAAVGGMLAWVFRGWARRRVDGMRTARRAAVRARAHEKRRTAEVATARTVDGLADQDADAPPPMPPEIEGVLGRILDEVDAEQRAKRSRR